MERQSDSQQNEHALHRGNLRCRQRKRSRRSLVRDQDGRSGRRRNSLGGLQESGNKIGTRVAQIGLKNAFGKRGMFCVSSNPAFQQQERGRDGVKLLSIKRCLHGREIREDVRPTDAWVWSVWLVWLVWPA